MRFNLRRFALVVFLAVLLVGCDVLGIASAPTEYGSIAIGGPAQSSSNTGSIGPTTQATGVVQPGPYNFDHYQITVSGTHFQPPLKASIPPGQLVEGTALAFEKVPVGKVVVYGEVIGLDLSSVLATISVPVTVEANKTTTVWLDGRTEGGGPKPPSVQQPVLVNGGPTYEQLRKNNTIYASTSGGEGVNISTEPSSSFEMRSMDASLKSSYGKRFLEVRATLAHGDLERIIQIFCVEPDTSTSFGVGKQYILGSFVDGIGPGSFGGFVRVEERRQNETYRVWESTTDNSGQLDIDSYTSPSNGNVARADFHFSSSVEAIGTSGASGSCFFSGSGYMYFEVK